MKAPGQPGEYILVWDVVHETRAWLSTEGVPPARTFVRVVGRAPSAVATTMKRLPQAIARPARPALWAAALRIAREHPLLGIGPDNFRHVYGRYCGHASVGHRASTPTTCISKCWPAWACLGLAALLWLVRRGGVALWHALPQRRRARR